MFKKIGKYRYSQRHCLGEGSFGKVFEGTDENNRRVAIKKIQQRTVASDPYLKSSLNTQIAIMTKLKHKNITQLIQTVITQNSIYLILEFCSGGDLRSYSKNKKLSQEEVKIIMKQIIDGFQIIVKQGIIHRDLKPANILVHEGLFKICDFGFAKYFCQLGRMAKTVVGTPIYMSPQVLKHKPYTAKTDIWSLGVIYYELLFHKIPFLGRSQDEIYKIITRQSLVIPNCSQFSLKFLKNTLAIQENQRWEWNKVFQHFQNKENRQNKKQISFYQNFFSPVENFLFKKNSNQNKPIQPDRVNNNQSFNKKEAQNKKNGNSFNYKFINNDSPERDQRYQNKQKGQRIPKNILAQQIERNPQPFIKIFKPQNQIRIQRPYSQQEVYKIHRLYSITVQFLLRTHFNKYQSYSSFIYSLVNYSLNEYVKLTQNMKDFNSLRKTIFIQERTFLEKVLTEIKVQTIRDLNSTASMFQLQAKKQFNDQQNKWIQQIIFFNK